MPFWYSHLWALKETMYTIPCDVVKARLASSWIISVNAKDRGTAVSCMRGGYPRGRSESPMVCLIKGMRAQGPKGPGTAMLICTRVIQLPEGQHVVFPDSFPVFRGKSLIHIYPSHWLTWDGMDAVGSSWLD
jgi:hypothetical protein